MTKTQRFRDQRVKTLLGGIDYYLEQRKLENMRAVEAKSATEKEIEKAQKKDDGQLGYKERKQLEKDIRSLSRKLADVEAEIENLEETLEDWDAKLADADSYMELMKDPDFYPKYEKKKRGASLQNEPMGRYSNRKRSVGAAVALLIAISVQAQPKLVVQVVVDQMRAEYLQRFNHQFAEDGGFRILLDEGKCTAIPTTITFRPTRDLDMRQYRPERPQSTTGLWPTTGG